MGAIVHWAIADGNMPREAAWAHVWLLFQLGHIDRIPIHFRNNPVHPFAMLVEAAGTHFPIIYYHTQGSGLGDAAFADKSSPLL